MGVLLEGCPVVLVLEVVEDLGGEGVVVRGVDLGGIGREAGLNEG